MQKLKNGQVSEIFAFLSKNPNQPITGANEVKTSDPYKYRLKKTLLDTLQVSNVSLKVPIMVPSHKRMVSAHQKMLRKGPPGTQFEDLASMVSIYAKQSNLGFCVECGTVSK